MFYPLYLQVYERSSCRFEKLTREFFCGLGRLMPEIVRFLRLAAGGAHRRLQPLHQIEGDAIFAEYIGLDYSVAPQLHLYHYAVRDMISRPWRRATAAAQQSPELRSETAPAPPPGPDRSLTCDTPRQSPMHC